VLSLVDYLNENVPSFYTADLGILEARTYTEARLDVPVFDSNRIEPADWSFDGVDIELEFGERGANGISVHEWLGERLVESETPFVLYDHGSGEIADFVTFRVGRDEAVVSLYHCKAAKGRGAGARVKDVYELAGQVAKSIAWGLRTTLMARIKHRLATRGGATRFLKGDLAGLSEVLEREAPPTMALHVVAVNPGVSMSKLSPSVAAVLAAPMISSLVRPGIRGFELSAANRVSRAVRSLPGQGDSAAPGHVKAREACLRHRPGV